MKLVDFLSKNNKDHFFIMHLSYGKDESGEKANEL